MAYEPVTHTRKVKTSRERVPKEPGPGERRCVIIFRARNFLGDAALCNICNNLYFSPQCTHVETYLYNVKDGSKVKIQYEEIEIKKTKITVQRGLFDG